MTNNHFHEEQFFDALRDIFVGAEIEGDSGFINLMRIKSRYYQEGVFPQLKRDIDDAVADFRGFREELFDKLYTFFQRYFSESGSIYFRYTPLHHNIYEKVYTDDRDVVLFWKTHMLYYVKTDRIFNSLSVEVDDVTFYFDAENIEHKRANEKRDVVFTFREVAPDGTLVFDTVYSVRGRITKIEQILRDLRKADVHLADETLEKAFRVFEKQSEVDYFINKNARAFLEEQFDLWMYQYLFAEKNIWTAERLAQLQALKDIAYKVIGFISQFEDELVKIWNKPKFVRGSHYVLTLDHLITRGADGLLADLFAHAGVAAQIAEWVDLGMLKEKEAPEEILRRISARDLTGAYLHPELGFLPLDTKYFPDLELRILGCFEDLDNALDGWLIHSENYQALNTLLHKFNQKIRCIHIDPPYNTDTSNFHYLNSFQHSSWLTMMDNRISKSMDFLTNDGSILCHADENEYERLQLLFDKYALYDYGALIWDKRNPMLGKKGIAIQHEYIVWRSKDFNSVYLQNQNILSILSKVKEFINKHNNVIDLAQEEFREWLDDNNQLSGGEKAYRYLDEDGNVFQSASLGAPEKRENKKFYRPLMHPFTKKPCPVPSNGFSRTPETMKKMIERNEILFGDDESTQPRRKLFLTKETQRQLSSVIQESGRGKMDMDNMGLLFPYCHPISLYETIIGAELEEDDINLDFFAGSGTTAHAVMNLNREDGGSRKYILVEMGDHFHEVILPRVKKVAFNSKWKDGKPVFEEGESGMSHFVKYYALEGYEDVLRRVHYEDADLFHDPAQDPYHSYVFLRDLKLLESVELDHAEDKVRFHPERLYPDMDLAETLSHLRGKWIKRITEDFVEFQDGEQMSLSDPDWETLKPMVWWR